MRGLGAFSVTRLLLGGCMDSSASTFDPMAEVHLAAMCAYPAASGAASGSAGSNSSDGGAGPTAIAKGCLFAGAVNFDPSARESGPCRFLVFGCTDPSALNYNSEATSDPLDSCIMPVRGCTVRPAPYFGVDPQTPHYKGSAYGSALRGVGLVPTPETLAVTNYNASANVLDGCELAIDGCQDPLAINYDPHATVNERSWCIPKVDGCMMPPDSGASVTYLNPSGHLRQGLAANYDAAATWHVRAPTCRCVAKHVHSAPGDTPVYAAVLSNERDICVCIHIRTRVARSSLATDGMRYMHLVRLGRCVASVLCASRDAWTQPP